MSRDVVWLFGRGLSVECGVSWVEPLEWKPFAREERVGRIKKTLRAAMDAPKVNTLAIRRFLDYLGKGVSDGCRYLLLTTNWDSLLQREIDIAFPEVSPWPKIKGVFHLNGTVEDPLDANGSSSLPRRTPLLLEDDPAEKRVQTVEGNWAFNLMIWEKVFVVVGMSFECQTDKFLLHHLSKVQDDLPIGESRWVIVNPDRSALGAVSSRIQKALPRAKVNSVCSTFSCWQEEGFPGLEA